MGDNNTSRPERRWVSPVKELGCSSQRIRNGSQQSAEIADGLLVARDSSAGSQHPRRIAAG